MLKPKQKSITRERIKENCWPLVDPRYLRPHPLLESLYDFPFTIVIERNAYSVYWGKKIEKVIDYSSKWSSVLCFARSVRTVVNRSMLSLIYLNSYEMLLRQGYGHGTANPIPTITKSQTQRLVWSHSCDRCICLLGFLNKASLITLRWSQSILIQQLCTG